MVIIVLGVLNLLLALWLGSGTVFVPIAAVVLGLTIVAGMLMPDGIN